MKGHDLQRLVENSFDVIADRSNSEELVFICPIPGCGDQTGNRSVNLKTGKTNCWKCGNGGDFVKWARYHQFPVEVNEVATADLSELQEDLEKVYKRSAYTPIQKNISLPEGFTPLTEGRDSCYYRFIKEMAENKNLTIEDFERVGAGYTRKENLWEAYCIFPVTEYGKLVYYQGRTYSGNPDLDKTKRFPSRKELQLGAGYWVYNLDALRNERVRVVVIVESILNVLSLNRAFHEEGVENEYAAVCVFKHTISTPQILKLNRFKHVKDFCILFDHDATDLAVKEALRHHVISPTYAEMPATKGDKTDANDDVYAALEAIAERKRPSVNSMLNVSGLDLKMNQERFSNPVLRKHE